MSSQIASSVAIVADTPTPTQDLLRFTRYVEPLVELITNNDTETPFTIGIFGKWGTGKTTLMQMIEERIQDKSYPTIWFNPWLYQREDNLIVPLLQTIHDSLQESRIERFKTIAQRVATVVTQVSASILMKTLTLDNVSLEDIEKRVDMFNEQRAKNISTIRTLRNKLQKVVDDLTDNGKNGRLLLYIDDLDRCLPTKVINLFEAIKLFLDLKHTIIFVAIDKEIVQQGIQVFYKDFNYPPEKYEVLTTDYMDKMIQLPFYLNPLGPKQIGEYLQQLPPVAHLADHNDLFQQCLQPNPRKIKRVLNIYSVISSIVDNDPDLRTLIKKSLLVKLIVIQQQWNDLYRHIVAHPKLLELLEKVYKQDLDLHTPTQWGFLNEQAAELRELCTYYYHPSSQLNVLFTHGDSFQDVPLDQYLFMLG